MHPEHLVEKEISHRKTLTHGKKLGLSQEILRRKVGTAAGVFAPVMHFLGVADSITWESESKRARSELTDVTTFSPYSLGLWHYMDPSRRVLWPGRGEPLLTDTICFRISMSPVHPPRSVGR